MNLSFTNLNPEADDGILNLLAKILSKIQDRASTTNTALASAARTASTLSSNFSTRGFRGIIVYLNITAASGTGGLTPRLFGVDPLTLAVATSAVASTPVTTVGLRVYHFGVGCGAANAGSAAWGSVGVLLGALSAIQILHADASSYTYSVSYELVQ